MKLMLQYFTLVSIILSSTTSRSVTGIVLYLHLASSFAAAKIVVTTATTARDHIINIQQQLSPIHFYHRQRQHQDCWRSRQSRISTQSRMTNPKTDTTITKTNTLVTTDGINYRPSSTNPYYRNIGTKFFGVSGRLVGGSSSGSGSGSSSGSGGASSGSGSSPPAMFTNRHMFVSQGIVLGINTLGLLITLVVPSSHYHVDLLGTGAFAVSALPSLLLHDSDTKNKSSSGTKAVADSSSSSSLLLTTTTAKTRIQWSSIAVITWSVKLASYLFYRIMINGHDSRLDAILKDPTNATGFWFVSAMWGIVCTLPHSLGCTSTRPSPSFALQTGGVMYSIGLVIETVADYQKWMFKLNHPGQYCNIGLWSISQHPNWFGNVLLWCGIFVMNAPALIVPKKQPVSAIQSTTSKSGSTSSSSFSSSGWSTIAALGNTLYRYRRVAVAALGPLFMYGLFQSQATGTLLGESYNANLAKYGYGTDTTFTKYIDTTPKLIPIPMIHFINKWW